MNDQTTFLLTNNHAGSKKSMMEYRYYTVPGGKVNTATLFKSYSLANLRRRQGRWFWISHFQSIDY